MKNIRKITLLSLVVIVLLCGCASSTLSKQIYDYNNDDVLKKESCSYSYNEKLGSVGDMDADIHFDFSGNDLLWELSCEDPASMTCSYDMNIESGDFKIIAISPSSDINVLWETGSSDNSGSFDIPLDNGTTMIKIVGKKAVGDLSLHLEENEDVNVTVKPVNL